MTDENSKRKANNQLTPVRTSIRKEASNEDGDMESLFGAPPLLPGDDPAAYNSLLAGVTRTLKPTEIISKFYNGWDVDAATLAASSNHSPHNDGRGHQSAPRER